MLRPGDEPIPGYQLERFLGKGQFGQVWQSSSPGKTSVALKFLNLGGKEGWREFRSIQQIKGVRHAHLMPITALWLLDEQGRVLDDDVMASIATTYRQPATETLVVERESNHSQPAWLVVAQLLGEKTLADRLKEYQTRGDDGIPPEELIVYMEEAAKGIDFLNSPQHDLGEGKVALQHCDIKPANMLLMGGSVLICDFGVTRTLAGQGLSATATSMVGSPAYMAPECIERRPSNASDQYALAVSYYELRTGHLPFDRMEYLEVLDAHRRGKLNFSGVTPAERKVLMQATSVQPKDRYATAAEMVAELKRAVMPGASERPSSRWPLVVAGLVSVAAVACICVAAVIARRNRPIDPLPTASWQLQVVPREAEVVLDDQVQATAPQGMYRFELPSDEARPVTLVVRKPPEFLEVRRVIQGAELREQSPFTVALTGNAEFFLQQSSLQLSSGDEAAAIASLSRAISIDDHLATFPRPQWLQRPEVAIGKILSLAVTADGKRVACGNNSKIIRLWELAGDGSTWESRDIARKAGQVFGVTLTARHIISTDYRGLVDGSPLNSSASPFELQLNPGLLVTQVSADQRWLAVASLRSDLDDGANVDVWDLQGHPTAQNRRTVTEHQLAVTALAITADSQRVISVSRDGTAQIGWLTKDEPAIVVSDIGVDQKTEINALALTANRVIMACTLSPTEGAEPVHRLVAVDVDGRNLLRFPSGHAAPIETVAVSASGRWIASGCDDGLVQLWQWDGKLPVPVAVPDAHKGPVSGIYFDATEQWMVTGGDDGRLLLWDLRPDHLSVVTIGQHTGTITAIMGSPEGWVVTAGEDGTVRRWDVRQCQRIKAACDTLRTAPMPARADSAGGSS